MVMIQWEVLTHGLCFTGSDILELSTSIFKKIGKKTANSLYLNVLFYLNILNSICFGKTSGNWQRKNMGEIIFKIKKVKAPFVPSFYIPIN